MKTNLMAAGIALMLVAMAMPADAYHLSPKDHPGWFGPGNALITTCEGESLEEGFGGACFFSTNKNMTNKSCATGDPADWCKSGVVQDNDDVKEKNVWSRVQALDNLGLSVPGFYRVGVNAHGLDVAAGGSFYYKELLADWLDGGHVTYFPAFGAGPAPQPDPVNPGEFVGAGTYEAEFQVHSGQGMPSACENADGAHNGPDDGDPTTATGTGTFKSTTVCTDVLGSADDPISDGIDLLFCVLDATDAFVFVHNDAMIFADDLVDCLDL